MPPPYLTNFISYLPSSALSKPRIGHLDFSTNLITPLSFPSGTHLTSLNQVINANKGTHFIPSSRFDAPIPLSSVTLLPPLTGRDILAVGKNYPEHAKEFNSSGFDSSDKVDIPTHPVIFTKRASSIIASGEKIYPHLGWTETLDYEGEIGVIIGREGFGIKEEDAWDYVWGFTIINDITARERQRDHKQFFLGKSADTFCPMGPVAVPITSLPDHKSLRLITRVNSELRQESSLTQLIFPIPSLIATISSAITLQPGDVLATGTPAGVGIGRIPPLFLKPGDTITVSVLGLGTLTNTVAAADCPPIGIRHLPPAVSGSGELIRLYRSGKLVHVSRFGPHDARETVIFIHGLGTSSNLFLPVAVVAAGEFLRSKQVILYDLEGHGRSPTTPESVVSICSYANDLEDLIVTLELKKTKIILVAYSMGCYIALNYVTELPEPETMDISIIFVSPLSIARVGALAEKLYRRAETVREHGMRTDVIGEIMEESAAVATSHVANSYIQTMLASTDPEGYAKGCTALAQLGAEDVDERLGVYAKIEGGRRGVIGRRGRYEKTLLEDPNDFAQKIRALSLKEMDGVGLESWIIESPGNFIEDLKDVWA